MVPANFTNATTLATRLKGKILLQVESNGEAWYVEPKTGERYYMANGDEAYKIMRNLGVGITNKDLEKMQNDKNFATKHSGKIFLQVESRGEAYYVDFSGNLYYLKNGTEAFNIMRNLGLGITNKNLGAIPAHEESNKENGSISNVLPVITDKSCSTGYVLLNNECIDKSKDSDGDKVPDIYDMHPNDKSIVSNKVYDFRSNGLLLASNSSLNPVYKYSFIGLIPRDYYMMYAEYFTHKFEPSYSNILDFVTTDDDYINFIAAQFTLYSDKNKNIFFDQLAIDFVQQLFYNTDQLTTKDEYPKYPVETLMDGSGDCEDLSFLLASFLQFGKKESKISQNVALLVFDSHVAVGLSLDFLDNSDENRAVFARAVNYTPYYFEKNNHKYYYIETTNDSYDLGEMPTEMIGQKANIYELN